VKRDRLERNPELYLSEIIDFIDRIDAYIVGMTYDEFAKDNRTIDAVDANERKIGEAVRVLAKHRRVKESLYRFRFPYIDLSEMRTDLTHEYFAVNISSIWKTAQTLRNLKTQFTKVLDELKLQKAS